VAIGVVIDSPVDVTHPDLFLNIRINIWELPVDPFDRDGDGDVDQDDIDELDAGCDADGLLTFWDLNFCQELTNLGITPPDSNPYVNPGIDACDFWEHYHNEQDEDQNGYFDDLVGWNFNEDEPVGKVCMNAHTHGTSVAQALAAVANNSTGIAGTAWRISIIPLPAMALLRQRLVDTARHTVDVWEYVGV